MELRDFRTPQHPSLGTNNWGGASPLLAKNVPAESLEQKYLKLHSICALDEIFPVAGGDEDGGISSHLPCPIGSMIGRRKDGKAQEGSNGHAHENQSAEEGGSCQSS
ncbi:hypothetical protein NL676_030107 [Syzygium grande]|nr:hypothetical protein NL676_030107 [Syzygium grande]